MNMDMEDKLQPDVCSSAKKEAGDSARTIFCPGTSMVADEADADRNKKKLILASLLCFLFMMGEIVGGLYAGSLAIISDAVHLFSDIAGFVISLAALVITKRRATSRLSYGFHRAEVIGAVFSVSLVWAVTAYLVYGAIERIHSPQPVDGKLMFIVAVLGLVVNIIMAFVLHYDPGHRHVHGQVHSDEAAPKDAKGRRKNLNVRAAFIHVIGDLIQSVGVLVAAFVIYMQPSWTIADPVSTLFFSVLVLFTTFKLLKESIHVLMEGTPMDINPSALMSDLLGVRGVKRVHDLHIWSLSSSKATITVHIAIEGHLVSDGQHVGFSLGSYNEVLAQCQGIICEKYHIGHSTIQVECDGDTSSRHCPS